MRVCILVGGKRLLQDPLLQAVAAVKAAGGEVTTITWFPVEPAIAEATAAHVELREVTVQRWSTPAALADLRQLASRSTPAALADLRHLTSRSAPAALHDIQLTSRLMQVTQRARKSFARRAHLRAAQVARLDSARRLTGEKDRVSAGLQRRFTKVRRKTNLDGQAALVQRLVSHDPVCRALMAEADILVAGDLASIRAVWFVVRRRPEIQALSGLVALRTYLTTRQT